MAKKGRPRKKKYVPTTITSRSPTQEIRSYFIDSLIEMNEYLKGRPMVKSNEKQAYIPEGAKIIHNNYGTAPGIVIEKDEKIAILLPGPPRELEPLFKEQVREYLKEKSDFIMKSLVIRLFGSGESALAEKVRDLMENDNPTLAPYAKDGEVTMRITAKAKDEAEADELIKNMYENVKERVGEYIYGFGEEEMASVVCRLLAQEKMTVAAAESCTAGMFTATLADNPGASEVLSESVVTYSNDAKEKYLGVSHETLSKFGAVSYETAKEMAEGIKKAAGSDIGVSITGIAGPGGGTKDKPVGLVYVGVAHASGTLVKKLQLFGDRKRVRHLSVLNALNEIRKILLDK